MKTKKIFLWSVTAIAFLLFSVFASDGFMLIKAFIYRNNIKYTVDVRDYYALATLENGKQRIVYDGYDKEFSVSSIYNEIVYSFYDTLLVYKDGTRYGYINLYSGLETIPATYKHAFPFKQNKYACVVNHRDSLGVINSNGEIIIPFTYQYDESVDYIFYYDNIVVKGWNNKYGVVDTSGRVVFDIIYDRIFKDENEDGYIHYYAYLNKKVKLFDMEFQPLTDTFYDDVTPLYNGILIKNNGKYGVLGDSCRIILDVVYDDITQEEDGYLVTKKGKSFLVSFDGEKVITDLVYSNSKMLKACNCNEDEYDEYEDAYVSFYSDYLMVYAEDKWGLVSVNNNKVIIKPEFYDICALSDSVFKCTLPNSQLRILINDKGEIIK